MVSHPEDMENVDDSLIPERLREIPQPPKNLYMIGALPNPETHVYLCVVGSRRCSNYGERACRTLIAGMAGYPVVIVSGLAFGIDAIAHKVAIEAGIKTVAFPGSGLAPRALYPAAHLTLAQKIIDTGGALLSEFEPDVRAAHWTFPARNRLMAGIAQATLIIEAEHESGTLITADLAMQYNRDVFVVPGSIFSDTSFGTNNLIKQGATPITHAKQLLEELGFKPGKEIDEAKYKNCSDNERAVLDLLREPKQRSELIRSLDMPIHEANVLITAMEIKGLIKEQLGEVYKN